MRYLSIDIEATGLNQNDYIIEYAMIPFDAHTQTLESNLARHYYLHCPSFDNLKPSLDPWVIEHNETLIRKAHKEGLSLKSFRDELSLYLENKEVRTYFANSPKGKVILFGKSLNAIDLPFLTRDLGWDFMRKYFHHQVLDLSSIAHALVDFNQLPEPCRSGSELMSHLQMGAVCHTALEDAKNTALMYLKLLTLGQNGSASQQ